LALGEQFFDRWTPRVLGVLRMVTGYLYLQHGTAKLLHVPHVPMFDQLRLLSLDGFAGMLEIGGSVLIVLGLFTRPVAFLLSGEMAIAYFLVHARQGNFFMPALNQGELAVLYCFIFLFLATAGGGSWSIDALRARKRGDAVDPGRARHSDLSRPAARAGAE
jgi:putative oxidoreductase